MKNLKVLREAAGLSQLDLAEAIGVKVQLISAIETGLTKLPPKHFKVLAKTLRIDAKYFVQQSVKQYKKSLETRMRQ